MEDVARSRGLRGLEEGGDDGGGRGTVYGRLRPAGDGDGDGDGDGGAVSGNGDRGGSGGGGGGGGGPATTRWSADFDLLVGADGRDSLVRREALLASREETDDADGADAAAVAAPQRRGYHVYRGVCCGSAGDEEGEWGLDSFQTWGPGLRFASVPLAGDERVSA